MLRATMFRVSLTLGWLLAPPVLGAEPPANAVYKPSAEAIRATWDFFYRGQGQGFVLAEAKLCLDVPPEGARRAECVQPLPPGPVKVGTVVTVWQAYLVPQGDTLNGVTVQLRQADTVRETRDVKVKAEGWRVRAWNNFRLTKPGAWNIVIQQGPAVLRSFALNVQE